MLLKNVIYNFFLSSGKFSIRVLKRFCEESPEYRKKFLQEHGNLFLLYRLSILANQEKEFPVISVIAQDTLRDYLTETKSLDLFKKDGRYQFDALKDLSKEDLADLIAWFAGLFDSEEYSEILSQLPPYFWETMRSFLTEIHLRSEEIFKAIIEHESFFKYVDMLLDTVAKPGEFNMCAEPFLNAPWAVISLQITCVSKLFRLDEKYDDHRLYFLTHFGAYIDKWAHELGLLSVFCSYQNEYRTLVVETLKRLGKHKMWDYPGDFEKEVSPYLKEVPASIGTILETVQDHRVGFCVETASIQEMTDYLFSRLKEEHSLRDVHIDWISQYYPTINLIPEKFFSKMDDQTFCKVVASYQLNSYEEYQCVIQHLVNKKHLPKSVLEAMQEGGENQQTSLDALIRQCSLINSLVDSFMETELTMAREELKAMADDFCMLGEEIKQIESLSLENEGLKKEINELSAALEYMPSFFATARMKVSGLASGDVQRRKDRCHQFWDDLPSEKDEGWSERKDDIQLRVYSRCTVVPYSESRSLLGGR